MVVVVVAAAAVVAAAVAAAVVVVGWKYMDLGQPSMERSRFHVFNRKIPFTRGAVGSAFRVSAPMQACIRQTPSP